MTWKQIEASREIRLWTREIVIPAITVAGLVLSIPEVRQTISEKFASVKRSIKEKLNKDKTE